jgi:hypothetical protein
MSGLRKGIRPSKKTATITMMSQRKTSQPVHSPQACRFENRDAPIVAKLGGGDKLATAASGGRRKVDGVFLRIGTVNVGTMRKREGEVVEMLERRKIDIFCLHETRWRGGSAKSLGALKRKD